MIHTVIGSLADASFARNYAEPLFRLRYRVFHERLHWDVHCHDEMETDEYDDLWTRYVVAVDDADHVVGGWRLRPTIGNYMLADVFPQLLYGTPAPHHPRVWESNRFVCDKQTAKAGGFGFGDAARALFRDRKSTRLNSSHSSISYAVFCLKKKRNIKQNEPK